MVYLPAAACRGVQAQPPAPTPRRNFGLDVLRCAAIAVVLANHAFQGFFVALGGVPWEGRRRAASLVGFLSIEWLFVLSGFLIGTMMVRTFDRAGSPWRGTWQFWLRRWFRTVPNYYLFLVVNALIFTWGLHGPLEVGPFRWRYVLFAQNLAWPERVPFFFNEAWSLALDEWFYFVLPLLVAAGFLVAKLPRRDAFVAATAALIVVPTVLRLLVPMPPEPLEWDHSIRRVTILHLDATGWGVLGAITSRWMPGFWSRRTGAKAALGLAAMLLGLFSVQQMFGVLPAALPGGWLTAWPRFPVAFAITLTGAGTFLMLPWLARLPAPHSRARGVVEAFSNYTYSIYLAHFPLMYLIAEALVPDGAPTPVPIPTLWLATLVWLPLTVAVSAGVHHAFEKPVSDLRDRFTRKVDASPFGPATPP